MEKVFSGAVVEKAIAFSNSKGTDRKTADKLVAE
jgi:hypothetical protein